MPSGNCLVLYGAIVTEFILISILRKLGYVSKYIYIIVTGFRMKSDFQ